MRRKAPAPLYCSAMALRPTPRHDRPFIKMHGLENHFVIVDARSAPFRPADEEIARICNVRTGVGADQLIVIEPPQGEDHAAFMRIYNVDGREAEACGNATRCVAWLLLEEQEADKLVIATLAGNLACRRAGDLLVSCGMGRVSMDWQDVPLAEARDTCHLDAGDGPLADGVALNIGNPHVVDFVDDLDSVDVAKHGAVIQKLPLFPEQVNVGVAQLLDEGNLRLSVYERGAGLTTACGSGACVAAFAALARGLTDRRQMTVRMPAGAVTIDIDDSGFATMTGPVAYCFDGVL